MSDKCRYSGCSKSIFNGNALYRGNKYGVEGEWYCLEHLPKTSPVTQKTIDLTETIAEIKDTTNDQ